ncbi:MAG: M1 family aminopeptidase [Chitinophagales bacterium]
MKYLFVLFLMPLMASGQQPELLCALRDEGAHYREHNVDFEKLQLTVSFQPLLGKIIGNATYTFSPIHPVIDSLFLDAPGIQIKQVSFSDQTIRTRFQTNKDGLIIFFTGIKPQWHQHYQMQITYEAQPRKGLYFIGWRDTRNLSRKQIWTQGQGIDNRHWFPCYDDVNDKLITETNITFDSSYTVISNGELKLVERNAGLKTWHYAMNKPHAPYLVMLAIDKYAHKDVISKNGIVSRQYYYADHPETYAPTYAHSADMMDFLAEETGVPYPWTTYSNTPVQDFMFGAMENTTATIFGDFYLLDARGSLERGYTGTNAHELTHQWFGDYITEWSAAHHWLHESFATYYSKQYMRKLMGEAHYETILRGEANAALSADRTDRFPVAHSKAGTNRHYSKGSHVIDMIRYVVGDAVFKSCIQYYLKKHAYGQVDSHDFERAFMEHAGINLDWFFDEWVYHSGFPRYAVSRAISVDATTFFIQQTQHIDSLTGIFKMPVVLQVFYRDGTSDSIRPWLQHAFDTVVIANPQHKQVAFTLFDPGSHLIKGISFPKSMRELQLQARSAPHMLDRFDAISALHDTSLTEKKALLIELFYSEKEHGVKEEILRQLSGDTSVEIVNLLKSALSDGHFLVRREALDAMPVIPTSLQSHAEKLLRDSSYYTMERAFRLLVNQFPEKRKQYLEQTKNEHGISENMKIAWLEVQAKEDSSKLLALTDFTSLSYEFRTRLRAMEALERLNLAGISLAGNLIDAMLNPNGRLARPATRTFQHFLKNKSFRDNAQTIIETGNWRDWEKEILQPLMK